MTTQLKALMLGVVIALGFLIVPDAIAADPIVTDSTSVVTTTGTQTTTVKSPPPSAIQELSTENKALLVRIEALENA